MNYYSSVKSEERKDIITAWAMAGEKHLKKIYVVHTSKYKNDPIISINSKSGAMWFSKSVSDLMCLKISDKIEFVILNSSIFLFKSSNGVAVRKGEPNGLRSQSRPLGQILNMALKKLYMRSDVNIQFTIRKTESFLKENILFEVIPNSTYKRLLKEIKSPI